MDGYKQRRQAAKIKRNESDPNVSTTRRSKPASKPSLYVPEEDKDEWAKGRINQGGMFADDSSESYNSDNDSQYSDAQPNPSFDERTKRSERPVPLNNNKKERSLSEPPIIKRKPKKVQKRANAKQNIPKGVFSDSDDSSVESHESSDTFEQYTPVNTHTTPTDTTVTGLISQMWNTTSYEKKAKQTIKTVLTESGNDKRIALSFKGGKESCVLLHLVIEVMNELQISLDLLEVLYFAPIRNEIQQLRDYVELHVSRYGIKNKMLKIMNANDIGEGLQSYILQNHVSTLFIGIKTGDIGHDSINHISKFQDGMQVTRVCPLLTWVYSDVWEYIKRKNIKTCELYEDGYTSLQYSNTSIRNPNLIESNKKTYKHASTLECHDREKWSVLFPFRGKVIKGMKKGRHVIGFPTAKLDYDPRDIRDGIYIGKAKVNDIDKKSRKAIVSVSSRQDLTGKNKRQVVVYIKHKYSGDFYGHTMDVSIIGILRHQQRFENEQELRKAMDGDLRELEKITIDKDGILKSVQSGNNDDDDYD